MLVTLITWLYLTILTGIYGLIVWLALQRWIGEKRFYPSPFILFLLGLTLLAFLGNLFSLFFPLHKLTAGLIFFGALALGWINRLHIQTIVQQALLDIRQRHWFLWLPGSLLFVVALLKTVVSPTNWDTGLYHAQSIRWLETYPVVPGLGNLLDELAFNSSWLTLNALFSFPFLFGQSLHLLTGWLFLLISVFFLSKTQALFDGKIHPSAIAALVFLFLARRLLLWELSSPGTDAPTTLLIWYLVLLEIEQLESRQTISPTFYVALILTAIFTVTVKLSALPILLWIILPGFRLNRPFLKRTVWLAIAGSALVLLPWCIRNVILSGYLVYPVPALDLFDFDWKVPAPAARDAAEWIRAWARLPGIDKEITLSYSLPEWLPLWYNHQQIFDLILLFGSLASFTLFFTAALLTKHKSLFFPSLLCFLGVVFWFWQAPDFRFGYGFIGALLACSITGLVQLVERTYFLPRLVQWLAILSLLVFALYQMPKLSNAYDTLITFPIMPADYPESDYNLIQVNNVTLHVPEHKQCWYAPLPCSPYYPERLFLRGLSLAKGFKILNP